MRKAVLLAIILLGLVACSKDGNNINVPPPEPPFPSLVAQDTITQGNFWAFNIGDPADIIYQKIQQTGPLPNVGYMGVTSYIYFRLEDIEAKFPLFKDIVLRDPQKAEYVIINFDDNKVTGISTDAKAQNSWPVSFPAKNNIRKGDDIGVVYEKLLTIRSNQNYARYFGHISLVSKNMTKEYEAGMSLSPKWQLYAADAGNQWWHVDLNFSGGKLNSVSYQLLKYH
jgi:hypothetical protein